jgi:hypothetical protein
VTIYIDNIKVTPAAIAHGNYLLLYDCLTSGRVVKSPQSYYFEEKYTSINTLTTINQTKMEARGWRVWVSTNQPESEIHQNPTWGEQSAIDMRAISSVGTILWDDSAQRAQPEGTKFAVIPHPQFLLQLRIRYAVRSNWMIRGLLIMMQPY